jgi:hypothetical protein
MALSKPYVRSALASIGLFVIVGFRMLQRYPPPWTQHHGFMILMLGFACVLTPVLVGTFSPRSTPSRSWLNVGLATFACWFVVACLLFVVQEALYSK